MLPVLWLSSCLHWTSSSANNSPDANEQVPPRLSLSYHACGLMYWSGRIDQEGDDTAALHDLLRFLCSWSGLSSGAAAFASVPLYTIQLELHEKVKALTAWDPPVRKAQKLFQRLVLLIERPATCFAFFNRFFKITVILIPWMEEMKWAVFCSSKKTAKTAPAFISWKTQMGNLTLPAEAETLYQMLKQQSKHTVIAEQVDHMSPFNGKMSSVQTVTSWPSTFLQTHHF